MKPLAILFAGQGAQTVGMGLSALTQTPQLNSLFSNIQHELDFDLKGILSGQIPGLDQTRYTQPSLVSTSILYYQQLQSLLQIKPTYFLGFSLGEYTALFASGHTDLATTLRLIQYRAKAMATASENNPGIMAAILGLPFARLDSICQSISRDEHLVVIANINSPGQLVISGHSLAVKEAMLEATKQGAKRTIALNVSGAFHSPLMQQASLAIASFCKTITFQPSHTPMIFNWTGKPLPSLADLPKYLTNQVKSSVQFESSIQYLTQQGVHHFLEIGPGNVLTNLVKKINPNALVASYNGMDDLQTIKELFI
jgi:[acyl-carrier-protein] S-malonyltransferase